MKILVVGATGTLGKAVVKALGTRHEVIEASRQGRWTVDLLDEKSIHGLFEKIGPVDAVVSAAGHVKFAPFVNMSASDFAVGLQDKLMGQVNLARVAVSHLNPKGSITLTSGILNRDPIVAGSSAAMVNGAIDGFVKGAAIELPNGIRINAVSPTVFCESMAVYGPFFPGFKPVPVDEAAQAFVKSIEGAQTGQVIVVG